MSDLRVLTVFRPSSALAAAPSAGGGAAGADATVESGGGGGTSAERRRIILDTDANNELADFYDSMRHYVLPSGASADDRER